MLKKLKELEDDSLTFTERGIFTNSRVDSLVRIFKKLQIKGKTILDAGSGNGLVCLVASAMGAKSFGVEADKELFDASVENARRFGLQTQLLHGDYYKCMFAGHDIVYNYPDGKWLPAFGRKIREMQKGAVVVVYQYRPLGFDAKFDKKSNMWVVRM